MSTFENCDVALQLQGSNRATKGRNRPARRLPKRPQGAVVALVALTADNRKAATLAKELTFFCSCCCCRCCCAGSVLLASPHSHSPVCNGSMEAQAHSSSNTRCQDTFDRHRADAPASQHIAMTCAQRLPAGRKPQSTTMTKVAASCTLV
jgi:hypothetical protein